jgi:hypothetical protein
MSSNREPYGLINYDAYVTRANELRWQEVDRLVDQLIASFARLWHRPAAAAAPRTVAVTPRTSQC